MKTLQTQGIILSRVNFGEADRIITLLTPQYGKLRLMAKGVRRVKSKLAGGIELFSISDITFTKGKGDIGTLVSSRLAKHYGAIVKNLERTMLGYELLKLLNRTTEDGAEPEYFSLLQAAFEALDDTKITADLIQIWFSAQLLKLAGHSPNLQTDDLGNRLDAKLSYNFNLDKMSFAEASTGRYHANHIKLLRLLFSQNGLRPISKIQDGEALASEIAPLVRSMSQTYIRI